MPPTVKSLEERIDDIADDMSAVKIQLGSVVAAQATGQAQLAAVAAGQTTTQTQLAVVATQLDAAVVDLTKSGERLDAVTAKIDDVLTDDTGFQARTTRDLDRLLPTPDKLDGLIKEVSDFRARTVNSFGVARWAATFAAGVFFTVLGSAYFVVRDAGRLDNKVGALGKAFEQQQKLLEDIRRDIAEIKAKPK